MQHQSALERANQNQTFLVVKNCLGECDQLVSLLRQTFPVILLIVRHNRLGCSSLETITVWAILGTLAIRKEINRAKTLFLVIPHVLILFYFQNQRFRCAFYLGQ